MLEKEPQGGAQSWLLEGPVPTVGTGLPLSDLCVLCFRLLPWCSPGLAPGGGATETHTSLQGATRKQCGQAHSEPLHGARVLWRAGTRSLQSCAQHTKQEVKIYDRGHQRPLRPASEFTSCMQTLFEKRTGRGRRRRKKEEGTGRATFLSSEGKWDSLFSDSLSPDQVAYNSLPSCI